MGKNQIWISVVMHNKSFTLRNRHDQRWSIMLDCFTCQVHVSISLSQYSRDFLKWVRDKITTKEIVRLMHYPLVLSLFPLKFLTDACEPGLEANTFVCDPPSFPARGLEWE